MNSQAIYRAYLDCFHNKAYQDNSKPFVRVFWSQRGFGFGEIVWWKEPDGWKCDTEFIGEFAFKALHLALSNMRRTSNRRRMKKLRNNAMYLNALLLADLPIELAHSRTKWTFSILL